MNFRRKNLCHFSAIAKALFRKLRERHSAQSSTQRKIAGEKFTQKIDGRGADMLQVRQSLQNVGASAQAL